MEERLQEKEGKNVIGRALDFRKLKKENFLVIFLVGILLLVIAWPAGGAENGKEPSKSGILDSNEGIIGLSEEKTQADAGGIWQERLSDGDELAVYRNSLERTLEELLSCMEGAGRVKVMITLQSSGEAVVEKDISSQQDSSEEEDSEGGSRISKQFARSGETVYASGAGGGSSPYVKQILSPRVEGVVVCAQGGGDQRVNKNITEAIQALFGIEAHKIKVITMSSK